MGLLDEAIREHLDLKRRRGADPAEIERAEREAFGPVRRDFGDGSAVPEPSDLDATAPEDLYAEPHLEAGGEHIVDLAPGADVDFPEHEDEGPWHEPAPSEDPHGMEAESLAHDVAEQPSSPPSDAPHDEPPEQPRPVAAAGSVEAPVSPEPAFGETAEFDVESTFAQEHTDDDGDPLEETPEFLQDAPEHDRLWFEQRPPRDFDFDS